MDKKRVASEQERLNEIARDFTVLAGFDAKLIKYRFRELLPFIQGPQVLELGPADGGMTEELVKHFPRVECVDASPELLKKIQARLGSNVKLHHSLFERFDPGATRFDTVLMTHVLEHVLDPLAVLVIARRWLGP